MRSLNSTSIFACCTTKVLLRGTLVAQWGRPSSENPDGPMVTEPRSSPSWTKVIVAIGRHLKPTTSQPALGPSLLEPAGGSAWLTPSLRVPSRPQCAVPATVSITYIFRRYAGSPPDCRHSGVSSDPLGSSFSAWALALALRKATWRQRSPGSSRNLTPTSLMIAMAGERCYVL
jgi:hypothetical protein